MRAIYIILFALSIVGVSSGMADSLKDSQLELEETNASGRKDDFEDITRFFQIRNVRNGIALNIERKGDFNTQNWFLRDFGLKPKFIKGRDPLAKSWGFGYVQFVDPRNQDRCLSIGEDGFLHYKSCKQDLKSKALETIFSIIPTSSGAVQIRSMVLEANECLTAFENPRVPIEKSFGIQPCSLDFDFLIDTRELFFFTPALTKAIPLAR